MALAKFFYVILLFLTKFDIISTVRVVNLSSGSDGNLTYLESKGAKILIDAGLSCREIETRLSLLGVLGSQIDAILITHEHSDHVRGVDIFASKFKTKVYAHLDNWSALEKKLQRVSNSQKFQFTSAPFQINDLTITSFKVPHDSACCVGFSIESENKRVSICTDLGTISDQILSICTDLGTISDQILSNIYGSQLVYLEANHDIEMLKNNINYSASLKQRILSSRGHLSNIASAQAIEKLFKNGTKRVVLSHLSKENNTPGLAYETVKTILEAKGVVLGEKFFVDVASTLPGKIYKIT